MNCKGKYTTQNKLYSPTLESEIDIGQGINIGPGKFVKKNKRRAFNKAVGPGKKSKINKRRAYVYSGL